MQFGQEYTPVSIHTIILPTTLQPDTLAAIFLLKKFGSERYLGIKEAAIAIWQMLPEGETPESLEKKGYLLIDVGGGRFDHHTKLKGATASLLVANDLEIVEKPALAKLLEYARRDDLFGRGTISDDPIDRAFGLSALIYNLNKSCVGRPERVAEIILPVFAGHYNEEVRRTEELPKEWQAAVDAGKVRTMEVRQRDKKLSVVCIEADNGSLAGYLRSTTGGRFDIVVQKMSTGHVNILTRPTKRPDLRSLACLIRIREAELSGKELDEELSSLYRPARHPAVKEWYYDRATNSLQNGGLNPKEIPPTKISWDEFPQLVELGLSEKLFNPMSG